MKRRHSEAPRADAGSLCRTDRWIRTNPQMQLQAVEERKYYEDQAGAMGVPGGLLPAIRAARLPITAALREA